MRTLFLVTVALIGCNQPVGKPYKGDCLTFWSEHELNESDLDFNVKVARKVMSKPRGQVGPISQMALIQEKDFCSTFQGAYIFVREEVIWHCTESSPSNPKGECLGATHQQAIAAGIIELGRSTDALAHELTHYLDYLNHIQTDDFHAHWNETGRWKVDIEYVEEYKPLP